MTTARAGEGARIGRPPAEDTRTLLVDTALRLFAARGVDAVSLREIGVEAGQKNTGVINYYFGDRDGLIRAVVERFVELHPEFEAEAAVFLPAGRGTARQVASALVRPLALMLDKHPDYLQLVARLYTDMGRAQYLTMLPVARWFRAVEDAISRRFGIGPDEPRAQFALTLTVHALADHARRSPSAPGSPEAQAFVDDLVDAVAAVLAGKPG